MRKRCCCITSFLLLACAGMLAAPGCGATPSGDTKLLGDQIGAGGVGADVPDRLATDAPARRSVVRTTVTEFIHGESDCYNWCCYCSTVTFMGSEFKVALNGDGTADVDVAFESQGCQGCGGNGFGPPRCSAELTGKARGTTTATVGSPAAVTDVPMGMTGPAFTAFVSAYFTVNADGTVTNVSLYLRVHDASCP